MRDVRLSSRHRDSIAVPPRPPAANDPDSPVAAAAAAPKRWGASFVLGDGGVSPAGGGRPYR